MTATPAQPPWLGQALFAAGVVLIVGVTAAATSRSLALVPWLGLALLELAGLWLILRPASYDYSAGRALTALAVALVGALVAGARAGSSPNAAAIVHLLWLLSMLVTLCVLLGASLWVQLQKGRS